MIKLVLHLLFQIVFLGNAIAVTGTSSMVGVDGIHEVDCFEYYNNKDVHISSKYCFITSKTGLISRVDVLDIPTQNTTTLFYPESDHYLVFNSRIRDALILETIEPNEILLRVVDNLVPEAKALASIQVIDEELEIQGRAISPKRSFSINLSSEYMLDIELVSNIKKPTIELLNVRKRNGSTAFSAILSNFVKVSDTCWYPCNIQILSSNSQVVYLRQTSKIMTIAVASQVDELNLIDTRAYRHELDKHIVDEPQTLAFYEWWLFLNLIGAGGYVVQICINENSW